MDIEKKILFRVNSVPTGAVPLNEETYDRGDGNEELKRPEVLHRVHTRNPRYFTARITRHSEPRYFLIFAGHIAFESYQRLFIYMFYVHLCFLSRPPTNYLRQAWSARVKEQPQKFPYSGGPVQ